MADDPTLKHFQLEPYAAVLTKLAQQHEPKVLMTGISRAAVDAGWIPYAHQARQTGKTVQIV